MKIKIIETDRSREAVATNLTGRVTLKSKSFFALQAIREFFSKPYQDRIARLSIFQFTSLGPSGGASGTILSASPTKSADASAYERPVRFAFSTHPVSLSLAFANFQMASSYVLIETSRSWRAEEPRVLFSTRHFGVYDRGGSRDGFPLWERRCQRHHYFRFYDQSDSCERLSTCAPQWTKWMKGERNSGKKNKAKRSGHNTCNSCNACNGSCILRRNKAKPSGVFHKCKKE